MTSPCTKVCRIHPGSGWCEGCGRTLGEIGAWRDLSAGGRRRIERDLARRMREPSHARAVATFDPQQT